MLRSGLIIDDGDGDYQLGKFVQRLLAIGSDDPETLASHMLPPAPPPSIDWIDFDHIAARDLALAMVRATATNGGGVNILLHGAGLADEQGGEPSRSERLAHLSILRAMTERSTRHLIVVDEADDLLAIGSNWRPHSSKLWLNRLIEQVATPTTWITNDAHALGETAVRRMHLAIGFDLPPPVVRARVIERAACAQSVALTPSEAARIAQLPAAPAVLPMPSSPRG